MTIDEAIQHIEEIINNDSVCEKCKDEHKQLAYWLEEYQKLDCALDRACDRLEEMAYALKVVYNSNDFGYLNADEWRQKFLKEQERITMSKEEYEMDEYLYRAADESYEERYEVEEDV